MPYLETFYFLPSRYVPLFALLPPFRIPFGAWRLVYPLRRETLSYWPGIVEGLSVFLARPPFFLVPTERCSFYMSTITLFVPRQHIDHYHFGPHGKFLLNLCPLLFGCVMIPFWSPFLMGDVVYF